MGADPSRIANASRLDVNSMWGSVDSRDTSWTPSGRKACSPGPRYVGNPNRDRKKSLGRCTTGCVRFSARKRDLG
jgi:hypothetical protein